MKIYQKSTALILSLAVLFCGSAPVFADSTSNNLGSDSVITTKIKTKMMADPSISSLNINVQTNNGRVALAGTVPTDNEATAAIITAESTANVKSVDASKLVVQQSSQPFADTVITAKIKGLYLRDKVFGDKPISVVGISVETKDGVVSLTGKATSTEAKSAVRLAKTIDGVKKVNSTIVVG